MIRPPEALTRIFDRFYDNLRSLPGYLKIICLLHRALQDGEISESVAQSLKLDEHKLHMCIRDEKTADW